MAVKTLREVVQCMPRAAVVLGVELPSTDGRTATADGPTRTRDIGLGRSRDDVVNYSAFGIRDRPPIVLGRAGRRDRGGHGNLEVPASDDQAEMIGIGR